MLVFAPKLICLYLNIIKSYFGSLKYSCLKFDNNVIIINADTKFKPGKFFSLLGIMCGTGQLDTHSWNLGMWIGDHYFYYSKNNIQRPPRLTTTTLNTFSALFETFCMLLQYVIAVLPSKWKKNWSNAMETCMWEKMSFTCSECNCN